MDKKLLIGLIIGGVALVATIVTIVIVTKKATKEPKQKVA